MVTSIPPPGSGGPLGGVAQEPEPADPAASTEGTATTKTEGARSLEGASQDLSASSAGVSQVGAPVEEAVQAHRHAERAATESVRGLGGTSAADARAVDTRAVMSRAALRGTEVGGVRDVDALLSGDVSVHDAIERWVDQEVDRVWGEMLSASAREGVRSLIRQQLETDPRLLAMVRKLEKAVESS